MSWLYAMGRIISSKFLSKGKYIFYANLTLAIFFTSNVAAQITKIDDPVEPSNIKNDHLLRFYENYSRPRVFRKVIGDIYVYYMSNNNICSESGCTVFIITKNFKNKPDLIIQSLNEMYISDSFHSIYGAGVDITFFQKNGLNLKINIIKDYIIVR